jgi:hypothetical protein
VLCFHGQESASVNSSTPCLLRNAVPLRNVPRLWRLRGRLGAFHQGRLGHCPTSLSVRPASVVAAVVAFFVGIGWRSWH